MSNTILQIKTPKRFITLCGRIFRDTDPQYYPRAEYRGRTILFCTESCLGAFLADPEIFYKVHRNSQSAALSNNPEGYIPAWKTIEKVADREDKR